MNHNYLNTIAILVLYIWVAVLSYKVKTAPSAKPPFHPLITSQHVANSLFPQFPGNSESSSLRIPGSVDGLITNRKIPPNVNYRLSVVFPEINKHDKEIQDCYNDFVKLVNEIPQARIQFSWTIGSNGEVVSPKVDRSNNLNVPLEDCIASQISRWKFPPPPDKKEVKISKIFFLRQ